MTHKANIDRRVNMSMQGDSSTRGFQTANRRGTPLRAAGGFYGLILTLCFGFTSLAWSQNSGDIEEPEPTRWRHPLSIQKPRHQAPPQGEPSTIAQALPLAPQLEWEPVTSRPVRPWGPGWDCSAPFFSLFIWESAAR